MIVPEEDKQRMDRMNLLLGEFYQLSETANLSNRYGDRLLRMVELASSRLVGCNDRFALHQEKQYWRHQGIALTYEGLKRMSGYQDTRCNKLDRLDEVVDSKTICRLIHLRQYAAIKNQEGLKTLIQMMSRLAGIPVLKVESKGLIKLKQPMTVQEFNTENIQVNAIEWRVIPDHYNGTYFHLVDLSQTHPQPTWGKTEYTYAVKFEFSNGLALAPFIQVSEEPLYQTIIDSLTASIDVTNKDIVKGESLIKQFIADYGQFAMIAEM